MTRGPFKTQLQALESNNLITRAVSHRTEIYIIKIVGKTFLWNFMRFFCVYIGIWVDIQIIHLIFRICKRLGLLFQKLGNGYPFICIKHVDSYWENMLTCLP